MLLTGLVLFLFCVASTQAFYAATGCTFDLMEDVKHPVTLIYESSSYILPEEKSTFQVNAFKPLLFYCPGAGNKFKLSDVLKSERTVEAACVKDHILQVSTDQYDIDQLNCTSYFYGDVIDSKETCADGKGVIYRIGYNVPEKAFYPLYEVCHQKDTGTTFYTQHDFRRYSKPDKLMKLDNPRFQQGPFFKDVISVYDGQRDVLVSLIGELKTSQIVKQGIKLSRGHLTPSADFVISGNRRATYQAINTAPQWQSINENNWNILEEKIRSKASKYHVDLKIISGTYGVLNLPNAEEVPTDIYLVEGKKVPVPEIIWKVVYQQDQGIAFISVNTPMNPNKGELCKNICNASMWGDWSDYTKGRIYCCEVSVLKNLIPYLPVTGITKILKEN